MVHVIFLGILLASTTGTFSLPHRSHARELEDASAILDKLPANLNTVAVDDKGGVVGYSTDGKPLGNLSTRQLSRWLSPRQSDTVCSKATPEQAQAVPGWNKLVAVGQARWGNGKMQVWTNDQGYPAYPAYTCLRSNDVQMSSDATASSCINSKGDMIVNTSGTNGTATTSVEDGTTYEGKTSTTATTTVGFSDTVTVKLSFPEVAEVSSAFTASVEVANSVEKSTTITNNMKTTRTIAIATPNNTQCHVKYDIKSCTYTAKGQVQYILKGLVWLVYDDWVRDKTCVDAHADCNGDGKCLDNAGCASHRQWGLAVDTAEGVTEDDRSAPMDISVAMSSSSTVNYDNKCSPL